MKLLLINQVSIDLLGYSKFFPQVNRIKNAISLG